MQNRTCSYLHLLIPKYFVGVFGQNIKAINDNDLAVFRAGYMSTVLILHKHVEVKQ